MFFLQKKLRSGDEKPVRFGRPAEALCDGAQTARPDCLNLCQSFLRQPLTPSSVGQPPLLVPFVFAQKRLSAGRDMTIIVPWWATLDAGVCDRSHRERSIGGLELSRRGLCCKCLSVDQSIT